MKLEVTVSAATREHLVESLRLIAEAIECEPDVTHGSANCRNGSYSVTIDNTAVVVNNL